MEEKRNVTSMEEKRNVTSMEEKRNAWKVSVWKPEENRPLESLRHMKE
jgi:hypothetical protein